MSRWPRLIENEECIVWVDGKAVVLKGQEAIDALAYRSDDPEPDHLIDETGVAMRSGRRTVRCPYWCGGLPMGDETDPKKYLRRHYRVYHLVYHGIGIPPSIRPNPNLKPPKP